jgi:hypothetical protein
MVVDINTLQYILKRPITGGKYNNWIVILQELISISFVKSKKSLVFVEVMSNLSRVDEDILHGDSLVDEHIFLSSSLDHWYGHIIIYLQTLNLP